MFLMLVLHSYTDLWGLFSIPTTDVFKFFFTIVDDYSRCTWIYLLKSKSNTHSHVVQFSTLVETFSFSLWVKLLLFGSILHFDYIQYNCLGLSFILKESFCYVRYLLKR
ncbi:hypothetical protein ACB092_11G185400 [Castanea dentata]